MPPSSTEISVAKTLVETVMIVLPIWLAAIRYFFDEFEGRGSINTQFSQAVLLIYVALAAVLVSSGVVISNLGNSHLSSSIYGIWFLFFATGGFTFWLIEKFTEENISGKYFNWFGIIAGALFAVMSFGLLVLEGM